MLDGYIICANIERFQELLLKPCDDERRQTLEWLLARERERLGHPGDLSAEDVMTNLREAPVPPSPQS